MKLETHNQNAEFYLASLALGVLEGMKQGVISPEAGIWSLARPGFSNQVLNFTMISEDLKYVIKCFDEIDVWPCFENGEETQLKMINMLREKCLQCLQSIDYKTIDLTMFFSFSDKAS